eukprot:COSAG02_NODE_5280_length_4475_cov_2.513026_4_plen_1048_part_00
MAFAYWSEQVWEAALRAHRAHADCHADAYTSMVHVGGLDTYIYEAQQVQYKAELSGLFGRFGAVVAIHLCMRQEVVEGRLKHPWAVICFQSSEDARTAVLNTQANLDKRGLRVTMFDQERMPANAAGTLHLMAVALSKARKDRQVQTAVNQYLETHSLTSPRSPRKRTQQNKHIAKVELEIKSELEQARRAAATADVEVKIQAASVAEEEQIAAIAAAAARERRMQTLGTVEMPDTRTDAQKQIEIERQANRDVESKSAAIKQKERLVSVLVGQLGKARAFLTGAEASQLRDALNAIEQDTDTGDTGSDADKTTVASPMELYHKSAIEAALEKVIALIQERRNACRDLIQAENECALAGASAAAAKRIRKEVEAQIVMPVHKDTAEQRLASKAARANQRETERRRRNKKRSAQFTAWLELEKRALAAEIKLQKQRGEEEWAAKQAKMKAELEFELAELEDDEQAERDSRKPLQRRYSEQLQEAEEAHRVKMQVQFEQASRERRAEMLGIDVPALLKAERDLSARRLIDHHREAHQSYAAVDMVSAKVFGQDLATMLVESLTDMEEELIQKVAALQSAYESLHRLRNSSMICTTCCRRAVVGTRILTEIMEDRLQSNSSSKNTDATQTPSEWVFATNHIRLAAVHGAVCNMDAELATYPLHAELTANDFLELYDKALAIRQRSANHADSATEIATHDDLGPWEHLDLLAKVGAQELGFTGEVWNAVPPYATTSMSCTTKVLSTEEEVRVELFVAFARIRDQIDRAETALKEISANIAQLRRDMSLMCMECMELETTQPLSNIDSIVRSQVVDGEMEYWVQFVGNQQPEKVSWEVIKKDTDTKSLLSTDRLIKAVQPVVHSQERELVMTRRLLQRELAPRSDYLRKLQLGIDAQILTEARWRKFRVKGAARLVMGADCKCIWLLPRAPEEHDGLLPLKIEIRTITGMVYGPPNCNHEGYRLNQELDMEHRELWRELSFTYQTVSGTGAAVALKTDGDVSALPVLLGLLVLRGVDIRAGTRGKLLWTNARMRLYNRSHKQNLPGHSRPVE